MRLRQMPALEPETTTTPATQVTTQSPSPDAPMETSETTTEPGRDLDVRKAERQPKRRRELEDVEITAVLAQPTSERTHEICGLLVHADTADNNYIEEGLVTENSAANRDGWPPQLLEKSTIVNGHQSGRPTTECVTLWYEVPHEASW